MTTCKTSSRNPPESCTLSFNLECRPFAHAALAGAFLARENHVDLVRVEFGESASIDLTPETVNNSVSIITSANVHFDSCTAVLRYLGRVYLLDLYENDGEMRNPRKATEVDSFLHICVTSMEFAALNFYMHQIDQFLALRTVLVDYNLTIADLHLWGEFKGNPVFCRLVKSGIVEKTFPNLTRWYNHVDHLPCSQKTIQELHSRRQLVNKTKKDQGLLDVDLPGTNADSIVVTRFPPEPSGYMHIGHAKALLLNEFYARKYKNGNLLLRFDDTNPSKEKDEYEEAIKSDVARLGVKPDKTSRTSDHFDRIMAFADQIIEEKNAYVDDTDKETMRIQRMKGEPSVCRSQSVEEAQRRWNEMKNGTEFGRKCCLRARMSVDNPNKAMRDPVLYRGNETPHHHTLSKFRVYPTYDFACPIVDSIEGVTHALRTSEYRDRNAQYAWMQEKLKIRKVQIVDFSRMNFVYTLLSKRKLQWFVENKIVTGWDDPRFPTVRGMLRRGLTVEALRSYVLTLGASQRDMLLEWDKLWSFNCRVIEPISPRYVAIVHPVILNLTNGDGLPSEGEIIQKTIDLHKKNPNLGKKQKSFSRKLLIDVSDAKVLTVGEEVTLIDWGNAIVTEIKRGVDGALENLSATLNIAGDVKKTKMKLTWLASEGKTEIILRSYDYLICKKKIEENEDFGDFVTPCSVFDEAALGDRNLLDITVGTILQFERRGFYICDSANKTPVFISVPDSKAASVASKYDTASKLLESESESARKESFKKRNSVKFVEPVVLLSKEAQEICSKADSGLLAGGTTQRRVSFSDDAIALVETTEAVAKVSLKFNENEIFATSIDRRRSSVRGRLRSPPPPM